VLSSPVVAKLEYLHRLIQGAATAPPQQQAA
jgi:hypothetical protein